MNTDSNKPAPASAKPAPENPMNKDRQIARMTPSSGLEPGMVVQFHGAKFRLRDNRKCHKRDGEEPVYTITGDWIEGEVVAGYFGPNLPWHFQGNDFASWSVAQAQARKVAS